MQHLRPIALAALTAMLCGLSTRADTPRVTGRHAPPPPVRQAAPPELWRATDGNEDTGDILGEIRDAAVDANGNTYLLDASFSTLRIYDSAGKPRGTVGRAGEGPGEFRNPDACLVLADGRLGVSQMLPGRIVTFDPQGDPGGDIVPPASGSLEILLSARAAAGAIYVSTHSMVTEGGGMKTVQRLRSLALDGSPRTVFKEEVQDAGSGGMITLRAGEGGDFTRHWAVADDGRVFVAPRSDAYEIEVFAPDGTLERVIALEYEHVRRNSEEIEAIESRFGSVRSLVQADLGHVDPLRRDVDALHPRPDGTLWVESSRGDRDRPPGTVGAFDVFDREGRFTGRLALTAEYDPEFDQFALCGDRLYVFREALSAPQGTGSTYGGGGAVMVRLGGAPAGDKHPDREPQPYAVVCYDLSGI